MKRLRWILLGTYLILSGLRLLNVAMDAQLIGLVAGLCALAAGVLFVLNR
jgi:hypothetical protein